MATNYQTGAVNAAYTPGTSVGGWSGGWNPSGSLGPTAYGKTTASPGYTTGQINAGGMPMNAIMYQGRMNPAWSVAPSGYTGITTNFEGNKYAPLQDILSQLYKTQGDQQKAAQGFDPQAFQTLQTQSQQQAQQLQQQLQTMNTMQQAIDRLQSLRFPTAASPAGLNPNPYLAQLIGGPAPPWIYGQQ